MDNLEEKVIRAIMRVLAKQMIEDINESVGHAFDGLLDEVGIWDKALTSTEVSDLYNSGNGLPYEAAAASTFIPRIMMS